MINRFNKIYRLTIQLADENNNASDKAIVITNVGENSFPLAIDFNVKRTIFNQANTMNVDIYNLAPDSYNKVFHDIYVMGDLRFRAIVLEAGYKELGLVEIFRGNIWTAYTKRNGTDIITSIEAITGIVQYKSFSAVTFEEGTQVRQIIDQAAKDMNVGVEVYGEELTDTLKRPVSLFGNSYKIIEQYTGGNCFLDNDVLKILPDTDAIEPVLSKITSESGILDQPQKNGSTIKIKCMFNPAYFIGQMIELESRVSPQFNGQYKLAGIVHSGKMSETTPSEATTELEVWCGTTQYGGFNVREKH